MGTARSPPHLPNPPPAYPIGQQNALYQTYHQYVSFIHLQQLMLQNTFRARKINRRYVLYFNYSVNYYVTILTEEYDKENPDTMLKILNAFKMMLRVCNRELYNFFHGCEIEDNDYLLKALDILTPEQLVPQDRNPGGRHRSLQELYGRFLSQIRRERRIIKNLLNDGVVDDCYSAVFLKTIQFYREILEEVFLSGNRLMLCKIGVGFTTHMNLMHKEIGRILQGEKIEHSACSMIVDTEALNEYFFDFGHTKR